MIYDLVTKPRYYTKLTKIVNFTKLFRQFGKKCC
jgi:hypothetical protein